MTDATKLCDFEESWEEWRQSRCNNVLGNICLGPMIPQLSTATELLPIFLLLLPLPLALLLQLLLLLLLPTTSAASTAAYSYDDCAPPAPRSLHYSRCDYYFCCHYHQNCRFPLPCPYYQHHHLPSPLPPWTLQRLSIREERMEDVACLLGLLQATPRQ